MIARIEKFMCDVSTGRSITFWNSTTERMKAVGEPNVSPLRISASSVLSLMLNTRACEVQRVKVEDSEIQGVRVQWVSCA